MNIKQIGPWFVFVLLLAGAGVFGGYLMAMFSWLGMLGIALTFLLLFIALSVTKGTKLAVMPIIWFALFGYISMLLSNYLVASFGVTAPLISALINGSIFYGLWTYIGKKQKLPI